MASPNLHEIHDALYDIALKAGDAITSANPSTIDTKKNCGRSFYLNHSDNGKTLLTRELYLSF